MKEEDLIKELEELGAIEEVEDLYSTSRDIDGEDQTAPLEPWQALGFYLEKFRVIKSGEGKPREQEALEFLDQGSEVALPYVTTVSGELTPYRIYPIAAYRIINAAVKVLEKETEKIIQDKQGTKLNHNTLVGIATLADTLFSGACTHPEGNFLIHKLDPNTGELTLKGHGRRIKQLATRLARWHSIYSDIAKETNPNEPLPNLSCREVVAQEIASSQQRFKITQGYGFEGYSPLESSDSLEALKENRGLEPSLQSEGDNWSSQGGYEEEHEQWEEEVAQANWIGINVPQNLRFRESTRGNILSENPKDWIWTYDEPPLDFIVNYVATHAKPCLEEAHSLLIEAAENPSLKQLGTYALTLDPKSKVNPDSYWKVIKRISNHFPSSKPESDNISRKLDTARFILSLSAVNKKLKVDGEAFMKNYQKEVFEAIDNSKASKEPITRNTILLKALEQTCPQMSNIEREQWLEHLQSFAVGAYENSVGMEYERKKMLGRINHLFKAPREELDKAKHTSEGSDNAIEKLNSVLQSASNAFYKYLSGKTGQMTRRELRTKLQSMKQWAEQRGDTELVKELSEMGKFISSISSQIKSGQWYSKSKENQETIFNFLVTMLKTPKPLKGPEFPGSKEPQPKDPLEITIDFLRSYGEEKILAPGKHTIAEVLSICKQRQSADDGIEVASALREITKNKTETLPVIQEREKALAGAISISERLHQSTSPIKEIAKLFEDELEIIDSEDQTPDVLDPFDDPDAPMMDHNGSLITDPTKTFEWIATKVGEFETNQKTDTFDQSPTWLRKVKSVEALTRKLLEASNQNEELKKFSNKFLEKNKELQRIINKRLEKNLSFWKGINYIGQNIQSRREDEKFQVSPTGRGTLQNIIAIVKAKIQGREVSIDNSYRKLTENKTLRQFKISKTRARTLTMNAGVPIALWLAQETKGTKTRIDKQTFVDTLKARHKACKVCLELNKKDATIEEKLHQFNEREREDRNAINTHILDQCITMLEDKEALVGGLKLIDSNRSDLKSSLYSTPALDTPNSLFKSSSQKEGIVPKKSVATIDVDLQ
jgi:hypothetical protein